MGRNRSSYSLHCALVSLFFVQGKVKSERYPRERERHQHLREKEERAILSALLFYLPDCFQVTALCVHGSTYCESMESFPLLRGLDFVCQQPQRKQRAGEEQSKSHHAQVPRKNKCCWLWSAEKSNFWIHNRTDTLPRARRQPGTRAHAQGGRIGDPSTAFQPWPGAVLWEGAAGTGWGMSLSRHHQSWLSAAAGASITARAPRASSWARAGCQTMSSELCLLQTQT